jgi:hypothetical protein
MAGSTQDSTLAIITEPRMRHFIFAVALLAFSGQSAFAWVYSYRSHSYFHRHHHHHHMSRHAIPEQGPAPESTTSQGSSDHGSADDAANNQSPKDQDAKDQASKGQTTKDKGSSLEAMIAQHAAANGVPVSLVHRVIMRESRYNARAVSSGNYGLMQIRLGTARSMGYGGSATGLLDPQTNLTYAVRYLAGAYRAAGHNESRAMALYASGYGRGSARRSSFYRPAAWTSFGGARGGSHAYRHRRHWI